MSLCVRAVALALFLGLASAAPGRIRDEDKYKRMEKWVTDSGGVVKVYVGINKQGHRSIFAREAIKEGDPIMTISGATLINVGSTKGSFLMPSLSVLREQMQPNSRFRPYLDILPPKEELMNACNIDKSLFPLIESEYWVWFIESWQDFLQHALDGKVNSELELTIPEMLGNVTKTLTINHLKEACAVSSTRYVATATRDRMLLIPFYDLANHERICPHYLTPYDTDFISFIAGKNVAKDEEICNSYGSDLRDDYVLLHYGFLQPIEDPPRLLLIDHHQFDSQQHRQYITEETFEREDKEGLEWEQGRLKHIQGVLKQFDEDAKTNKTRPARGASPITDMLLELQGRRRTAVDYHLKRIEKLLAKQAEL